MSSVLPWADACARVLAAKRPLLAAHLRPDGDAIGSTLGLAAFLRAEGAAPTVLLPEGIPALYRLRKAEFVTERPEPWENYDLVILLDTAVASRAGLCAEGGVPAAARGNP